MNPGGVAPLLKITRAPSVCSYQLFSAAVSCAANPRCSMEYSSCMARTLRETGSRDDGKTGLNQRAGGRLEFPATKLLRAENFSAITVREIQTPKEIMN